MLHESYVYSQARASASDKCLVPTKIGLGFRFRGLGFRGVGFRV